MADSPILPGSHLWKLNRQGQLPEDFWRFFRDLVTYVRQTQGNTSDLAAFEARLAALEQSGLSADILGNMSVQVLGSLADGEIVLQLRGDAVNPGPLFHYATDASGNKGWQRNTLAALADVDLTTPASDFDSLTYDSASGNWIPRAVGGSPNLDGGHADSTYGAVAPMDGGGA